MFAANSSLNSGCGEPLEQEQTSQELTSCCPTTRTASLRLLKKKLKATSKSKVRANIDLQSNANQASAAPDCPHPDRPSTAKIESVGLAVNETSDAAPNLGAEPNASLPQPIAENIHNKEENPVEYGAGAAAREVPIAELRSQPVVILEKRAPTPAAPASARIQADLAVVPPPPTRKPQPRTKTLIRWSCKTCQRECIPIREESRCLCGHRYKEHPSAADDPRVKTPAAFRAFACTAPRCACPAFFYIVAEGAWILRCRCKHKHIEHDARGPPHACTKPRCSCSGFDSPWICNCDHPWSAHAQDVVTRQCRGPLELLEQLGDLEELTTVHRTDLLAEPLQLRLGS